MLTPNTEWGGEGSLGCGIGYGYLHRIPAKKPQTGAQLQDPELGGHGDVTDGPGGNVTPGEGYSDVRVCVWGGGGCDSQINGWLNILMCAYK